PSVEDAIERDDGIKGAGEPDWREIKFSGTFQETEKREGAKSKEQIGSAAPAPIGETATSAGLPTYF
ncbi:hypothetical protein, partial [Leptospira ellisii]